MQVLTNAVWKRETLYNCMRRTCLLIAEQQECQNFTAWNTGSCVASWSQDSSVGTATRYGMSGPGIQSRWGSRFSEPVQTGSEAHPASYTMGTGSFPGVKRPGRRVDHPPPSSAEVKGRVEPCLYSPSGPGLF